MADTLTDAERRRLETKLGDQLRLDVEEAERLGYGAKQFRAMLAESGPIGACRRVIASSKIPDGFLTLLELRRLDLTAEATVLRGPWRALFEDPILDEARRRLKAYGRPDLALP